MYFDIEPAHDIKARDIRCNLHTIGNHCAKNQWSVLSKDKSNLSYDVASGSEITPCNKIDKPLVVYRFTGNVMTSIATLHT